VDDGSVDFFGFFTEETENVVGFLSEVVVQPVESGARESRKKDDEEQDKNDAVFNHAGFLLMRGCVARQ
jgi:hypothetical protein